MSKQLLEIQVDTGNGPVGLLREGSADVIRAINRVTVCHNNRKDEFVSLIQSVEDLVAGDGDGGGALGAPLDLDVAGGRQAAVDGTGQAGDVPAALLRGHVDDLMAEGARGDVGARGPADGRSAVGLGAPHDEHGTGFSIAAIIDQRTWKYFPQYRREAVAEGLFSRLQTCQGQGGVWFTGSTFSHELVSSVVEHARGIVNQMAPDLRRGMKSRP